MVKRKRTFAALILGIVLFQAIPAFAQTIGQVGGFEIDGDFAFPHSPAITGATRDWGTLTAVNRVTRVDDLAASASDSAFGGGSKEEGPDGWTFVSQKAPG